MEKISILSAYDEKLINELNFMSEEEIDKIIENTYSIFLDKNMHLTIPKRIEYLNKFLNLLKENKSEFIKLASLEGGKPISDTEVEVLRAIEGVEFSIARLRTWSGAITPMEINESSMGRISFEFHEPCGVVLGISAFNHPVNLIIHQVIPAIAAGCPVLIKPSLKTPLSCYKIVEFLYKAGLPQLYCQVLFCKDSVTEKIVSDKRISFVSFIGSSEVGWKLRAKLAPGTRCNLEHGGAAPVILHEDADFVSAIPRIAKGGFYHAGQVCVSVQKVFIQKNMFEKSCEWIKEVSNQLKVGDPLDEKTQVGPLINYIENERVEKWVDEAIKDGGKILCGGKRLSRVCYEPTVIVNPSDNSLVSKKEVFGPVICLYEYEDINEAIAKVNNSQYAFQASIFSKNIDVAFNSARFINAKTVLINDHTAFRVDWMPFGGYKDSGLGTGGIPFYMDDITIKKLGILNLT